jgi:hypothetical protein
MKERLVALWGKVVENKAVVIKVGSAVAGALLGVVVAAIVENAQEDMSAQLTDDDILDLNNEA